MDINKELLKIFNKEKNNYKRMVLYNLVNFYYGKNEILKTKEFFDNNKNILYYYYVFLKFDYFYFSFIDNKNKSFDISFNLKNSINEIFKEYKEKIGKDFFNKEIKDFKKKLFFVKPLLRKLVVKDFLCHRYIFNELINNDLKEYFLE